MNEEAIVEGIDEQASGGKPKRTRRAITPATALSHVIGTLEKLPDEDRRRALRCVEEYFAAPKGGVR